MTLSESLHNRSKVKRGFMKIDGDCGSCAMFQGEEGVREVLQILNDEFRLSMALSGETRGPVS